jgi:hypothetical protein
MADVDVLKFCVLIGTPHPMKNNVVIAVSHRSAYLAESQVVGCYECSNKATIRFERVLDEVRGSDERPSYILPFRVICPFCQSAITEKTLVQLRNSYL